MKKKLTPAVSLLLAFAAVISLTIPSFAAVYTDSITLSNDPGQAFRISARGKAIHIGGIPDTEEYKFIWLWLTSSPTSEKKLNDQVLERSYSAADGYSALYDASGVSDGTYYLHMFYGRERDGTYTSYVWKAKLPVKLSGGAPSFALSPVYSQNTEIFKRGRTDSAALGYYLKSTASIQSDSLEIYRLAAEITKGKTGDYSKARAVHDWVAGNISYNYDELDTGVRSTQTSLGVLHNKYASCEGYSNLNAALLRAAGIPAKVVSGYGLGIYAEDDWTSDTLTGSRINHIWNEAFIDGRWAIIDATWDSGGIYEKGRFASGGGMTYRKYFDPTLEFFSADHKLVSYSEASIPAATEPSYWAAEYVTAANALGLIPKTLNSGYQQNITRSEFSDLIVGFIEVYSKLSIDDFLTLKGVSVKADTFSDTQSRNVLAANALGIVLGYGNKRFDPDGSITREQAATMLYRTLHVAGYAEPNGAPVAFSDSKSFSSWSANEISFISSCIDGVYNEPLMKGTSADLFTPQGYYTREQAFITMLRMYNIISN
ncbi:MAG: S-layer homology domain-containing protein [Oscillospiraceae bacterium]|jgi:hypothetical protein|nr:S-layer homology domain-containing protein [Oscillospiraceae bacterium]